MSELGKTMVTGGAGFIGSTLVRQLLDEGTEVVVFDNFFSGNLENLKEVEDKIKIIRADIQDPSFEKVLKQEKIEYIFNLAAEPYIPSCYERPRRFFEVNANGTLNVLLAAKGAGVKRVVQYSSSEVYGTAKTVPMDENHPTLPLSTYAVSKLAADRLSYTLCHEQNIPVIILRQFNVYGPRETHPYIIPELISQLNDSNKLNLGNIKASRDLTYVTDAAEGAMLLMKNEDAVGEVFNMGYGEDTTVEDLAKIIAEIMGQPAPEINVEQDRLRPLDVEQLCANATKMRELTGWKPKVDLKAGLKKTCDWFKENGEQWIWEKTIAPEEKVWKKD